MELTPYLLEAFLKYTAVPSQSRAGCEVVPSTPGQWDMARLLAKDLEALGLVKVKISEHACVTALLPSNLPEGKTAPCVGWCCHTDTVDVHLSPEIRPVLVKHYDGGDILQNAERGIVLSPAEHPELAAYVGDDILVSDGTSVLGADNKAAVSNVMTMLRVFHEDPSILHGDIAVAFVPDEEVGLCGAKTLDLADFPCDYAYTIDCCELGELVCETFNAGSAHLRIKGVTAHPMSAKNVLVNPITAAVDFVNLLDRAAVPEHTEGTEGYIWVVGIRGDSLTAEVEFNIRDHSLEGYRAKKAYLAECLEFMRKRCPRAEFSLAFTDIYGNIRDAVTPENSRCIRDLYTAMEELSIPVKPKAMRGGTDGSWLSVRGLLTPNYFTGAHNFHSPAEFLPLSSLEASCRVSLKLAELALRETEA